MNKSPMLKVVVLGEGQVGKTSVTLKYVNDVFNEKLPRTVNASYLEKEVTLRTGKKVTLAIWDTAGQEMYNAMTPIYYRDALGAVVVYDITSTGSFEKVKKWINELRQSAQDNIVIVIVGNKIDLESQRKVKKSVAEKYAQEHDLKYYEVSARNGAGISKMFEQLAEFIDKNSDEEVTVGKKGKKRILLNIDKGPEEPKRSKKCC